MPSGANYMHKQLRTELEDYIKSQYFGKSPLLLSALSNRLDDEELLYQKPFIESSPAYVTVPNGIMTASIEPWMKEYFLRLSEAGIGVFPAPFAHQVSALEAFERGENLFVSTGTGSGKTECFMWPLLAKLATEARNFTDSWTQRGVRTIIMYPMNALVSDQVSRLRRMLGDPDNKFIHIFRNTCGHDVRRPQFGMYTGRTPYPGVQPSSEQDKKLARTLTRMSCPANDSEKEYFRLLLKEGKVPAKADMNAFLEGLRKSNHTPNEEDAELITRFEMQQSCPDILITNYSMLEYMLLRPREQKIWDDTRAWLAANAENRLLFVIDEAHMYRGSSGGEVALLIRRLFHKLGISRDRVQFILTTASMPNRNQDDVDSVMKFANDLTASDAPTNFCYLTGEREVIDGQLKYDIPSRLLLSFEPSDFENNEEQKLSALLSFWQQLEGFDSCIDSLESICSWMYDNLIYYRPFHELIKHCRGNAVSLGELSSDIFPNLSQEDGLKAISVLLAIAPLAKNGKGSILFPARMHMLFRGISGVYACTNEKCPHSHSEGGLTLGEIFLSNDKLVCPHCKSVVYELYNDRRCGALFFKGYVLQSDPNSLYGTQYLWHYPGQVMDATMKEIHLFIPGADFERPKRKDFKPCYLDVKSGFVNYSDDSSAKTPGVRKLYYCCYSVKGKPSVLTFPTCPHCNHQLSGTQLTSFSTRGNLSFSNLIKAQFQLQPAVPGKDHNPDRLPNEGRKVLLFSDSRQRAAKLARDMSDALDSTAIRQLFAIAIKMMEEHPSEYALEKLYDFFCLAAGQRRIQLFHSADRIKFSEDCISVLDRYNRSMKRKKEYAPQLSMTQSPAKMQEYLLRMFAGGYNTLYDSAISWIEPTEGMLFDAIDALEDNHISVSSEEFIAFFNAWLLSICDDHMAIGDTISRPIREQARKIHNYYGLKKDWSFSTVILKIMGWAKDDAVAAVWKRVLKDSFLTSPSCDDKLYVKLDCVKPRFDPAHIWYKCGQCSELTPFPLKGRCPCCGSPNIHEMSPMEYDALSFWRKPIEDALQGERIRIIDTEEHTAQLSHKDQRDDLWSKTEQYELRFQDLIQDDETPVDILSSTTTMEVGIDIGSLVAVGLRNIPPMRENYQQRAGRAGRRGSSLSTIVTFCEGGPHDTLYFYNPAPMFRGDPRKPWIDVRSEKLLQRHLAMVLLQEFLAKKNTSLDEIPASDFLDNDLDEFKVYLTTSHENIKPNLLPSGTDFHYDTFKSELDNSLVALNSKRHTHPELFGADKEVQKGEVKVLLDALYEEGIIPTYSFPKNVVSTYISDADGKSLYEVDRGLDIAIGEYAPGRAIVVDKQTYQIGGFYYPNSERYGQFLKPAQSYTEDPKYVKPIITCSECGWFDLNDKDITQCPFCGSKSISPAREMLRPWGFGPKGGKPTPEAQLSEEYTAVQQPLYSTLPNADDMLPVFGCKNIRLAARANQRIIMLNRGSQDKGFMVCKDCGAAMPGDDASVLENIERPYNMRKVQTKCRHSNVFNVNLGYDFITDMLVLEFSLDDARMDTGRQDNPWLTRAAQSLAEALRLVASKKLDVEFAELITGYRLRTASGISYVDIYLYDSLSSGAGYAVSVSDVLTELLSEMENLLSSCDCGSACSKCLKHYRNQHLHGILDRFAALQLLRWGVKGEMAAPINSDAQAEMILPLANILSQSGCKITTGNELLVTEKRKTKKLVVYPAMWAEPHAPGTIFVSDAYIKYSKPYAIQKILDSI